MGNVYCRISKVGAFDQDLSPYIEVFDEKDVKSPGLTLGSPGGG